MIALPLLILCDISISSGSTVMLRASARHLVVFHGFPRNFSASIALSCQALPIGSSLFASGAFLTEDLPCKFSISFLLKFADSVRL